MPIARFQMPDGRVARFEVPEGTTPEQAQAMIADEAGRLPQSQNQQANPLSKMEKVGRGVADPIEGAAQLLYNALPESVTKAGDQLNNWIADKTGLVAKIPQGGLNEAIKSGEADYQARRTAQGEDGIDGWRMAGNVISPANVAIAGKAAKVAPLVSGVVGKLGGNIAAGAVGAGAQGAVMPSFSEDYWGDKASQVATGAAVGGALPVLGKTLPRNSAAAAKLKAEGVDVPVGSAMGGIAKAAEDRATSLPLIGDAINLNRQKAIEQFNIATINKALAPIGEKLGKGVQAGHDAIAMAGEKVSNAYNALLPKLKVQADAQFAQDMAQLKQMAQSLPNAELDQFNRILANKVENSFTPAGLMSGETFKKVESELGRIAKDYMRAPDIDKRTMGEALKQVQANMRSMLERTNPMYAPQLQKINQAFAALQRPERAAAYVGGEAGVFTPAQLLSAVKSADPSLRHKAFSRGNALMQDWAESAKSVLPSKVPDSGTAGRLMFGGGALGGLGMVSPQAALAGGMTAAAYLPGGRAAASGLLRASEGVADVISNRAAYAAPLLSPFAYGLLGSPQ